MTDRPAISELNRPFLRWLVSSGQHQKAAYLYRCLLEQYPADGEAVLFLAGDCQRAGQWAAGLKLMSDAVAAAPRNAVFWQQLGMFRDRGEDLPGAIAAFQRSLELDAGDSETRLFLGFATERLCGETAAVSHYLMAIQHAQARQRWQDRASTPEPLWPLVEHAMRCAGKHRLSWFEGIMVPLRSQYGTAAMARVQRALAMHFQQQPLQLADLRQRPSFFYFPELKSEPVFARGHFPWLPVLEAQAEAIREEMLALTATTAAVQPFHDYADESQNHGQLFAEHGRPRWDASFFYRYGLRFDENHRRCPVTSAALAKLPLVHVPEHSPEVCFSLLTAGTHILPHRGMTNIRAVLHLPLEVPDSCALRLTDVGELAWQKGRAFVLDDSYEHEAWNHSDRRRVVMLADVWNPWLTMEERDAMMKVFVALADLGTTSN